MSTRPSDGADGPLPPGQAGQGSWHWRGRPWLASILVFALAASVRILHYSAVQHSPWNDDYIFPRDGRYFHKYACQIAEGDLLGREVFYMSPLYPYVLAIPYCLARATGDRDDSELGEYRYAVHLAMYAQAVLSAFTCVLIARLARNLAGRAAGVIAGLVAAVYGMFIYQDTLLLATGLITFLNVAALVVLWHAHQAQCLRWWLASGLLIGLCVLAHGTALLLVPSVVLWIMLAAPTVKFSVRIARIAVLCATVGACVAGVTLRNYVAGHDFVLLTSNAGYNFLVGHNANATGAYVHPPCPDLPGITVREHVAGVKYKLNDPPPSRVSGILAGQAWDFARQHPWREMQLWVKKLALFFNAVEVSIRDNFYFYERFSYVLRCPLLGFGLLAPIALTGLVCSLRSWRRYLLVYVVLASQVMAYTLTFVLGRYRLVAVTCLIVLAAFQVIWWIERLRYRNFRGLALSLIPLALFSVAVHVPLEGFTQTRGFAEQYRCLGERYLELAQDAAALESFEHALSYEFSAEMADEGRLYCLSAIAGGYARQGRGAAAEQAAHQALQILDRMQPSPVNRKRRRALENLVLKLNQRSPSTTPAATQ